MSWKAWVILSVVVLVGGAAVGFGRPVASWLKHQILMLHGQH